MNKPENNYTKVAAAIAHILPNSEMYRRMLLDSKQAEIVMNYLVTGELPCPHK